MSSYPENESLGINTVKIPKNTETKNMTISNNMYVY